MSKDRRQEIEGGLENGGLWPCLPIDTRPADKVLLYAAAYIN